MSDSKIQSSKDIPLEEVKSSHFTQAGALNDPSLSQLRDQIKKVMIPLLIKIFQYKLELSQSLSLPSRLQSQKHLRSPEAILEQLKTLDNDLNMLLLWCQSSRNQINKALNVLEEEQKNTVATPSSSTHPSVAKSFNEALSAQTTFFKRQSVKGKAKRDSKDTSNAPSQKTWWKKLLGD